MDHNVSAAAQYFQNEWDASERACNETAIRNGHTIDEAEMCDNGSVKCPDCPWKV